jgi:ribosomal protein S18 acetylase RimI-like enzyme
MASFVGPDKQSGPCMPQLRPIDANPYAFLAHLGNAALVQLTETPELSRLHSTLPVPMFGSTFAVRCGSSDALRACLDTDGPGTGPWWLGPSTTPAGADRVLAAYGLRQVDELAMMVADLHLLAAPDGVAGIVIEPVRDESGVRAWAAAYAAAHDYPTAVELAWTRVLTSLGTSQEAPLQHYVARAGDEPVASASVLTAAGVAGLYCVATTPADRGKGIGTAITRYAMADARDRGHHTVILGAEAPAVKLYRRIGFTTRGAMTVHAI